MRKTATGSLSAEQVRAEYDALISAMHRAWIRGQWSGSAPDLACREDRAVALLEGLAATRQMTAITLRMAVFYAGSVRLAEAALALDLDVEMFRLAHAIGDRNDREFLIRNAPLALIALLTRRNILAFSANRLAPEILHRDDPDFVAFILSLPDAVPNARPGGIWNFALRAAWSGQIPPAPRLAGEIAKHITALDRKEAAYLMSCANENDDPRLAAALVHTGIGIDLVRKAGRFRPKSPALAHIAGHLASAHGRLRLLREEPSCAAILARSAEGPFHGFFRTSPESGWQRLSDRPVPCDCE